MSAIAASSNLHDRCDDAARTNLAPLLVVAWWSFLFLYGIHAGELWRNEGLRARIALEMLAGGDWIVPHLYGEPIFTKPPLMYWAICLLSLPFGEVTILTARLPSALAGVGTALLMAWYFRRCLGARAGVLAALIVPCGIFWLEKVPSAEIDALQVFWVVGAILFFIRAVEAEEERLPSLRWWLLSALGLAGGTLTKWTAPVFLYGMAVPFLWQRGMLRLLFSRGHVYLVLLASCLVSGWIAAAIYQSSAEAFWNAVIAEAAPRLLPGANPKPYPWLETLFHPLVVLAAMLPWSLGLFWSTRHAGIAEDNGYRGRTRRVYQALHCWLWPCLLFWTIHPDHTLRNRAPLFPALAGFGVLGYLQLEKWWANRTGPTRQRGIMASIADASGWCNRLAPRNVLIAFLMVWTALKVVHVEVVLPRRAADRRVAEKASFLLRHLPSDAVIYLFRIKDECLFFYLNRPALRLASPDNLANTQGPIFCILTVEEWQNWNGCHPSRMIAQTEDGQGAPIFLVQVFPSVGEQR